MKRIIYLFAGACMLASCGEKKTDGTVAATADTAASTATAPATAATAATAEITKPVFAYPVRYSEWEIGNPANTKTVIDFYYAWDHKDANKVASLFADTVRLRIPTDREEIVVPNNQINERLGKNRGMYDSTSNNILSAVSLHDKASNEDWVMITTYNKWITKAGKRDSLLYHDNWRMKDSKIAFLMSFYKLPTEQFVKRNDPK
jgi:hypothetical protein